MVSYLFFSVGGLWCGELSVTRMTNEWFGEWSDGRLYNEWSSEWCEARTLSDELSETGTWSSERSMVKLQNFTCRRIMHTRSIRF